MAVLKSRRQVVTLFLAAAAIGLGWLVVESQGEVLVCDTSTYGVRVELHRNPLLNRQKAVVLMEPTSDLPPGVPPRYEIKTKEEAEAFSVALTDPKAPRIDVFSREFREQHCKPQ